MALIMVTRGASPVSGRGNERRITRVSQNADLKRNMPALPSPSRPRPFGPSALAVIRAEC
jgi:hypothetical protein